MKNGTPRDFKKNPLTSKEILGLKDKPIMISHPLVKGEDDNPWVHFFSKTIFKRSNFNNKKTMELQAKDLMIGNYVVYKGDEYQICSLHKDKIAGLRREVSGMEIWKHGLFCESIQLTKEWVLELGLIQKDNKFTIKRVEIELISNSFFGDHFHYNGTVIESVHELQNLCSILNKEELIKK